jgi:tRNA threonylcarbamoyl adenosine modification protein (Sua5/YciO/YrdC/YwlC family)
MTGYKDLADKNLIADLQAGKVGVLPTDTVYGLVCAAANSGAVKRLYELKSREKKPGTIVAAGIDQLAELGFKKRYLTAVEQFWPGAVSIEQPTSNPDLEYLTQGTGRQAVRVVADKALIALLKQTGPLLTSSANQPGEPTSNTIEEAQAYFGDSIDFYVDGGDRSGEKPSTLIRVVDDAVEVLREGAVDIKEND